MIKKVKWEGKIYHVNIRTDGTGEED